MIITIRYFLLIKISKYDDFYLISICLIFACAPEQYNQHVYDLCRDPSLSCIACRRTMKWHLAIWPSRFFNTNKYAEESQSKLVLA